MIVFAVLQHTSHEGDRLLEVTIHETQALSTALKNSFSQFPCDHTYVERWDADTGNTIDAEPYREYWGKLPS